LFRPREIHSIVQQHMVGLRDHSAKIWSLLNVELWFRQWMDHSEAVPRSEVPLREP
jgi:hypothetical protein